MIKLSGYEIIEQIYTGSQTLVYRGRRLSDRQPAVIKLLNNPYPSFNQLLQFRNQYTITKNLELSGIIRPYSLESACNSYALIMEDCGSVSLRDYTRDRQLPIVQVLSIAIQLAQILHNLHQNRVIHKDIKPANILLHPDTKQVKLIDFSISSLLPKETQEIKNPNVLEGTLAYLAPEQTGRMNRGIDYRSDFYALGVTLFELLTGKLPFASKDPMELVHCHIAKQPPALLGNSEEIPSVLADMVMKLMAKNAEDRYQSALGLKYDLEICLHQLKETGKIEVFEIGQRDLCDRFLIPEKLYGRETEVQTLLDAFDRVSDGSSELMLVAGFSGIGKTAVVNEVHKPIVRQRGYFIKGKFDQFNRNIPFSAFVQAFRDLMGQLLSEPDEQLAGWKVKILAAVGENGQVLIDVIPELEKIIGSQAIAPELSGSAAQNRFNLLFQKFIEVFTTAEHPLVLFLDDLQWADLASLQLLKLLMNDNGYLLLLGAYRDNEVSPVHPFMMTVEELQKAGNIVNTITLAPLASHDTNYLIADTLNCSTKLAKPLTELVDRKTQGNPFFITQFLKALHREGHIAFNQNLRYWQCDIAQITALALTDDVVEFIALQLQKLPDETQSVLKLAACIGNQFDLNTLAIVSEQSSIDVATALWKALQEGLILPTSQVYKFFQDAEPVDLQGAIDPHYRFLHDRIQQAAYTLIPENQKQATHLKIGQLWFSNTPQDVLKDKIFEIVNQLNIGADLIRDRAQVDRLIQLNHIAGQKAKSATAYAAAARYFQLALGKLTPEDWTRQYSLMVDLHLEAIKTEFFLSHFESAHRLADLALSQVNTLLEQVDLYQLKIQIYVAQNQFQTGIDTALQVLARLGIDLEQDTPAALNPETLLDLPILTQPDRLATQRILYTIATTAYVIDPRLSEQAMVTGVHCCIQFGNASLSAYFYVYHGMMLCSQGEIDSGYRFGQLSVELIQRFDDRELKSHIFFLFNGFIRHWRDPIQTTFEPLLQVFSNGLEIGEMVNSGYAILNYCSYLFLAGTPLEFVEQKYQQYLDLFQKQKLEYHVLYSQVWYQTILNLRGFAEDPQQFTRPEFPESEILSQLVEQKNGTTLFALYVAKSLLLYLLNAPEQSLACAIAATPYKQTAKGLLTLVEHNFYYSLALLADSKHNEWLDRVAANQVEMQTWAQHAPTNFQHKFDLVEAERYRVLGNKVDASEFYDRAIAGAKANGYFQVEALANELAAKFYLNWGKEKIARDYLTNAYYGYSRWGATAKIHDLERRYPNLLAPILHQPQSTLSATATIFATEFSLSSTHTSSVSSKSASISSTLDLTTILKASQTLSREIQLDKLLATLLETVLENAGADKAVLLMPHENQWFVEAVATIDRPAQIQTLALSQNQTVPHSLINTVKRSLESVAIANATTHPTLATDAYILQHSPKSLLCTPILQQGKVIAILYLENRVTVGAFTSDRIETLQLLTGQAAIALENARLYQQVATYSQTLEAEVERKTQALNQKNQVLEQALQQVQHAQAQLIHAEKMSSLGQMVGGIAHEINNPVNFIKGNIWHTQDYFADLVSLLRLYQQEYPQPTAAIAAKSEEIDLDFLIEDISQILGSMKTGSDRIQQIVLSLRNFARLDEADFKTVDIHEGIKSTLLIVQHRCQPSNNRAEIRVTKDYGTLPAVTCYPSQLNQVFLHILNNAIDAIRENTTLDSTPEIRIRTVVTEDEKICIQIANTHSFIPEEIQTQIFNPFFTTKPIGQGAGLGLSVSYAIIQKHRGTLTVRSQPDEGTEFEITIAQSMYPTLL